MADIAMIFSAPMIRALLNGSKTMTRRVVKPTWEPTVNKDFTGWRAERVGRYKWHIVGTDAGAVVKVPYANGDRIWPRETWRTWSFNDHVKPSMLHVPELVRYEADGVLNESVHAKFLPGRVRQSIHMPRWASRLTLHITGVKVERLHDISNHDAMKEGCYGWYSAPHPDQGEADGQEPWEEFRELWKSLHGAYSWAANPWVAAVSFKVEKCNINKARAAA
ncbi:MAG: hypothetical protein AAFR68_16605 [Pseudomonadota bacterium]